MINHVLCKMTDLYFEDDPPFSLEWPGFEHRISGFEFDCSTIELIRHFFFNFNFTFCFRLNPLITPPLEKSAIMTLSLQEVIIVGSCSEQVRKKDSYFLAASDVKIACLFSL